MNKKELNSKDLLLCFLYSPGMDSQINEPIIGRTKLTKMMYLFEKQIYNEFFKDEVEIKLPEFEAYYFGPFSKQVFEDLLFFQSIGFIIAKATNVPLSSADKIEEENAWDEDISDDWSDATFENEKELFESSFELSEAGINYVEDKVWNIFSKIQKEKLRLFKAQINKISLDSLLRYVYNKYPEDARNSRIAHKYLIKAGDENVGE